MTIKNISTLHNANKMKCFNCDNEEDAFIQNMRFECLTFKVYENTNSESMNVCLKCGFESPRREVAFAKFKHRPTIHLCIKYDGQSVSSRCGTFSGLLTDGKCKEVNNFHEAAVACKKCAIEMGAFYNDKIWLSSQGKEKELEFYRYL